MTIKLEVGKKYELNNGEVHECTQVIRAVHWSEFGLFVLGGCWYHQDGRFADCGSDHELSVKRCVDDDTPKLWRDMTPDEKGALLLAHHEGKVIEWESGSGWHNVNIKEYLWCDDEAYRVKHEPAVETVTMYGAPNLGVSWSDQKYSVDTHSITFNVIDGKPDCASIKMEEL